MKKILSITSLLLCVVILLSSCGLYGESSSTLPENELTSNIADNVCTVHKYETKTCMSYQECVYCGKKNDVYIYHTERNGYCIYCEKLISHYNTEKYIKQQEENTRHINALSDIETDYRNKLSSITSKISTYVSYCIYSKSECKSKISSINSQINQKESELSKLTSGSSLSPGNNSTTMAKRLNLQLQINNLKSERAEYQSALNAWNQVERLDREKDSLEKQYKEDIATENRLHETNKAKIEAQYK